mgnify:CR=1 FL=1|jgi:hypothetical protein
MIGAALYGSDIISNHAEHDQFENWILPTNNLDAFKTMTSDDCAALCNLVSDCILFTWCAVSNECRTQNSGALAYIDLGKTSGTNFC